MRKTAEQKVKAIYPHACIREDDGFYLYVYNEPCRDKKCCGGKSWNDRFIGRTCATENIAWNRAWKQIQHNMLLQLEGAFDR